MAERYWVTGVQLALIKEGTDIAATDAVTAVEENQFIGNFPTDADKERFIEQIKKIK